MFNFSVGLSLRLMAQTAPFVVFRMVVYFAIAVAYVLVTGVGAGIGFGVGAIGDSDFQASSTMWGRHRFGAQPTGILRPREQVFLGPLLRNSGTCQ